MPRILNTFQPGDMLVCIDNDGCSNVLTLGKEYTVMGPGFNADTVAVVGDNGGRVGMFVSRFDVISTQED